MNTYKQKFYSALKDTFIGTPIKGKSGFVNIMDFRSQYFDEILPLIEKLEDEYLYDFNKDQAYEKLYTFFKSYLNETGTPFFNETQIHKNLYDKIYSDREDVSLFWKTKNLYYVKSEALYDDLETEVNNVVFKFDASEIKHAKGNEKKSLEFYLVNINDSNKKELTFRVQYQQKTDFSRIKGLLKCETSDLRTLFTEEKFPNSIENANIQFIDNNFDYSIFSTHNSRNDVIVITNNDDITKSVRVEIAPSKLENIIEYLNEKTEIILSSEDIEKAFSIYKRQNEIDYFVHKDAERFLKEQFDIYVYNWLFNDLDTEFDETTVSKIQNIKKVAYKVIEYIARFEEELKAIWEKPKFVKNCNYVFTLDRLVENCKRELLLDLIKSSAFLAQLEEWKELGFFKENKFYGEIKKDVKRIFEKAELTHLPFDSKYMEKPIRRRVLESFENIDSICDGVIIKSDNWQALNTIRNKYKKAIELVYIDPPFNTEDDANFQYKDKFQDSTWLTLMENRLSLLPDMMRKSGSFYLHLDRNANYRGRELCEDIFTNLAYSSEIAWDTCGNTGFKAAKDNWIQNLNNILIFRGESPTFNKILKVWDKEDKKKLGIGWLDLMMDKDKNYFVEQWRHGKYTQEIIKVPNEVKLDPIGMIWEDIYSFLFTQVGNNESYFFRGGQKPENLLRRIIQSSTNPHDLVIDFFAGSGTTAAVAHKLNRKWVAIEQSDYANTFYSEKGNLKVGLLGRIKNVLKGDQVFYVGDSIRHPQLSRNLEWQGGGIIKYYELEQYEETLSKAKYKGEIKDPNTYTFMQEEKMLEAMNINKDKEKIEIDFTELYEDVDIPETISNLIGKNIKKIEKDKVIYEDDIVVDLENLTLEKYPFLKPLIWWRSKE